MSMPARSQAGVLAVAGARAAAWAPDWRALFAGALAKEADERRFFLWIPVAAMGGVALNLAADREPVALAAGAADRRFRRARLSLARAAVRARGSGSALAALAAGFLSMGLRTARVATPVLDHVRIVKLQGFVEEVDLRPVGARLVIGSRRRRRHAGRSRAAAACA